MASQAQTYDNPGCVHAVGMNFGRPKDDSYTVIDCKLRPKIIMVISAAQ